MRAALAQLRDALRTDPADPADIAALSELREAVAYILGRLNASAAALVSSVMLDELNTHIASANAAAAQYFGGGGQPSLNNLNGQVDAAVRLVGLPATVREESRQLRAHTSVLEDDLATAGARFAQGAAESQAAQAAVLAAIASSEERLGADAAQLQSDWQTAHVAAVAELTALKTEIATQQGRLDQAIATFQQQFSTAEAARAADSAKTQSALLQDNAKFTQELQAQATQIARSLQSDADEASANLAQTADRILAQLAKQLTDAKVVASKVGAIGMSVGYGEYAKQQQRSARNWNALAVVVFLTGFAVTGAFVLQLIASGVAALDLQRVLERALLGLALYILAGYAASQALRHRDQEHQSRRLELELASLDPFLALLDKTKQDELKATIALRYFGAETPKAAEGISQSKLVGQALDIIKEAVKKG